MVATPDGQPEWQFFHSKNMEIYVYKGQAKLGPFSEQEIWDKVRQGQLSSDDLAWHEGLEDWKTIGTIVQFRKEPPIPKSKLKTESTEISNAKNLPVKKYSSSSLAGFLNFIGWIGVLISVVGIMMFIGGNSAERAQGFLIAIACLSGSLSSFTLSKVISCLHEIVFHMRNLKS